MGTASSDIQLELDILDDLFLFCVDEQHSSGLQATL